MTYPEAQAGDLHSPCWLGWCLFLNHSPPPCSDIRSQKLSISLVLHCPPRKHAWNGFPERRAHDLVFLQVNQHSKPQIKTQRIHIIDESIKQAGLAEEPDHCEACSALKRKYPSGAIAWEPTAPVDVPSEVLADS